MFKKYKTLKWIGISLVALIVIVVSFGFWFMSLIPSKDTKLTTVTIKDLPYLSENRIPAKGKILAIVTSTNTMGYEGKSTGYELTELARAYYVFMANGFNVDIASPKGGKPPVVIDWEDMGAFDYAFLNDSIAQHKTNNTIELKEIKEEDYVAVYFVGGKGAMFDFPDNEHIQTIVRNYYQSNKVIGAVCHGPAALVNVSLDNGRSLVENKKISSFTNEEELLFIPEAETVFPFLLEDKLVSKGAKFNEGAMYLEKISHDSNLITGQNPWSVWTLAETMVKQLGYTPKQRAITAEENAVEILSVYHNKGLQKAKETIKRIAKKEKKYIDRALIAKHSIVAVMQGNIGQFLDILKITSYAKKYDIATTKI